MKSAQRLHFLEVEMSLENAIDAAITKLRRYEFQGWSKHAVLFWWGRGVEIESIMLGEGTR